MKESEPSEKSMWLVALSSRLSSHIIYSKRKFVVIKGDYHDVKTSPLESRKGVLRLCKMDIPDIIA